MLWYPHMLFFCPSTLEVLEVGLQRHPSPMLAARDPATLG